MDDNQDPGLGQEPVQAGTGTADDAVSPALTELAQEIAAIGGEDAQAGTDGAQPPVESAPTEPQLESELPEVPEDTFDAITQPTRDNWAAVRERLKEQKAELKALREEREAALAAREAEPQSKQQGRYERPPQGEYASEFLVKVLSKIESGEAEEGYRTEALQHLSQKSPGELATILQKAESRQYGEDSLAMADACRKYLPEVLANYQARQKTVMARQSAWSQVLAEMPDLAKPDSPDKARFADAWKEMSKSIPDFESLPNAPVMAAEYVKLQRTAVTAKEVTEENAKLKAEVDALKKRLGMSQSPVVGRGSKTGTTSTPLDELKRELSLLETG